MGDISQNTKYLLVMRHGQCASGPLSEYGREEVKKAAIELAKHNFVPDLVITSPTERTRETTDIIFEHFNSSARKVECDLFFQESDEDFEIKFVLSRIHNSYNVALLSGHAETVNSFAYHLLDKDECMKILTAVKDADIKKFMSGEKDYLLSTASTADVLILKTELKDDQHIFNADWRLHGYMRDGEFKLAEQIAIPDTSNIVKEKMKKDFPLILIRHKNKPI